MGSSKASETKYFGMDTEALIMAEGLDDVERLAFYDQWRTDCLNFTPENTTMPDYPKTMRGVLNVMAWKTARYVYETYLKRKHANPEGKNGSKDNDPSLGVNDLSSGVNDTQSIQNQSTSIRNQLTPNQINQIKAELKLSGYTDSEINKAFSCNTEQAIHNPLAYIRKVIDQERLKPLEKSKPNKTVPAQAYTQRDYSNEQSEAFQRMLAQASQGA